MGFQGDIKYVEQFWQSQNSCVPRNSSSTGVFHFLVSPSQSLISHFLVDMSGPTLQMHSPALSHGLTRNPHADFWIPISTQPLPYQYPGLWSPATSADQHSDLCLLSTVALTFSAEFRMSMQPKFPPSQRLLTSWSHFQSSVKDCSFALTVVLFVKPNASYALSSSILVYSRLVQFQLFYQGQPMSLRMKRGI